MMTRREKDRRHKDIANQIAEPEYLQKLRRQAEQIEQQKRMDREDAIYEMEANRLREKIRKAGHIPVC